MDRTQGRQNFAPAANHQKFDLFSTPFHELGNNGEDMAEFFKPIGKEDLDNIFATIEQDEIAPVDHKDIERIRDSDKPVAAETTEGEADVFQGDVQPRRARRRSWARKQHEIANAHVDRPTTRGLLKRRRLEAEEAKKAFRRITRSAVATEATKMKTSKAVKPAVRISKKGRKMKGKKAKGSGCDHRQRAVNAAKDGLKVIIDLTEVRLSEYRKMD